MLSRGFALAALALAVAVQVYVGISRELDPVTVTVLVVALGAVAILARLASAQALRAQHLADLKRMEWEAQTEPDGAPAKSEGAPVPNSHAAFDPRRTAAAQLRLTRFLAWRRGDLRSARPPVGRPFELLQTLGDSERALLLRIDLGWMRGLAGNLDAQERSAREVLRQAAPDSPAQMVALHSLGCVAAQRGDFIQADSSLRRAITLARAGVPGLDLDTPVGVLTASFALDGRVRESQDAGALSGSRPELELRRGGSHARLVERSIRRGGHSIRSPRRRTGRVPALARLGPGLCRCCGRWTLG